MCRRFVKTPAGIFRGAVQKFHRSGGLVSGRPIFRVCRVIWRGIAEPRGIQLCSAKVPHYPSHRRIYLSNVEGDIKVFQVGDDGKAAGLGTIALPPADAPRRKAEIPAGLAITPGRIKIKGSGGKRRVKPAWSSG